MSGRILLRVQHAPRDQLGLPNGEEELGPALFGRVLDALQKGLPRPTILALEPETVRQFDAVPLLQARQHDGGRLLAAVGGQASWECAALAGTLHVTPARGAAPTRAVVVYLEWPDNRWWTAWQLIGPEGDPVGDEPWVRRALDGAPRPAGMGGWFARVRREGLVLNLDGPVPTGPQRGLSLVH